MYDTVNSHGPEAATMGPAQRGPAVLAALQNTAAVPGDSCSPLRLRALPYRDTDGGAMSKKGSEPEQERRLEQRLLILQWHGRPGNHLSGKML